MQLLPRARILTLSFFEAKAKGNLSSSESRDRSQTLFHEKPWECGGRKKSLPRLFAKRAPCGAVDRAFHCPRNPMDHLLSHPLMLALEVIQGQN